MRTRLNVLVVAALLAVCSLTLSAQILLVPPVTHLTKADIGDIEGTSALVLVQFRRDGCRWCESFEREVLPEFRRLYVDRGRMAFTQVDLGPVSPFGNEVFDGKRLTRPVTEPILIIGQRSEDGGLDVEFRFQGFLRLDMFEALLFMKTGLPIPSGDTK